MNFKVAVNVRPPCQYSNLIALLLPWSGGSDDSDDSDDSDYSDASDASVGIIDAMDFDAPLVEAKVYRLLTLVDPTLQYTQAVKFKRKRQKKQPTTTMLPQPRRKRRRAKVKAFDLTVVTSIHMTMVPRTIDDAPQAIINAISSKLPCQASIVIYGITIPIKLMGVFYKQNQLTWIIENVRNHKIYHGSHFIADLIHLFHFYHHLLPARFKHIKFRRRSFSNTCFVHFSPTKSVLVAEVFKGVLQFLAQQPDLVNAQRFIEMKDHEHNFLRHAPFVHRRFLNNLHFEQQPKVRGRRVFKPLPCEHKRCSCTTIRKRIEDDDGHFTNRVIFH